MFVSWDFLQGFANCISVWGLADGSRNVNVDAEIVSYAILDVLAKPVFGFWLLFTHDAMSERYVAWSFVSSSTQPNIDAAPFLSRASGPTGSQRTVPSALVTTTRVRNR